MRLRGVHRLGVLALYLSTHLGVVACSSSSKDEQGEEVAAGEEGSEEGGTEEGAGTEEGGDNFAEGEEASGEGENLTASEGMGEQAPAEPTNSNLQGIIAEMDPGTTEQPAPEAVAAETPPEAVPAEAMPAEPIQEMATAPMPTPAEAQAATPVATVAAPAGTSLPELGSKMPYVVEHGDTLGKIAQKVYGDQSFWKEIRDLTSMQNPSRIYPGDVVYYRLDEKSMNFAQNYENQAKSEVTVAQGETLHAIAKRLGDGNLWRQIWRLNDSVNNPDELNVGQTIYYYGKATASVGEPKQNNQDLNASSVTIEEASAQQVDSSDFEDESETEITNGNVFAMTAQWLSTGFAG